VNTIGGRELEEGGAFQILSEEGDTLIRKIGHGGSMGRK
jgi:hypothetical protein